MMARLPRYEFEGAIYHIINRGNYRQDIFKSAGAAQTFLNCLYLGAEKSHWVLHAYCLMRNHFHLAIETPNANLIFGMHWLQSTFANKFNRYRKVSGHLFQGRYYALLVEPGPGLAALVNYIHLNPVRAGIVSVDELRMYRWSSYPLLFRKRKRPPFCQFESWLSEIGGLKDTPSGHKSYEQYLLWLSMNEQAQKELQFSKMCKGWVIGSRSFKKQLFKQFNKELKYKIPGAKAVGDINGLSAEVLLKNYLNRLAKGTKEIANDKKSAPWKVVIAMILKRKSNASNPWISKQLNMGHPDSISRSIKTLKMGDIRKDKVLISILSECRA